MAERHFVKLPQPSKTIRSTSEHAKRLKLDDGVIFFRGDAWQKMYDPYAKLIDVAAGAAELGDVYARMARLSSDALDNEEGSIDFWGRVLDIRGEDP